MWEASQLQIIIIPSLAIYALVTLDLGLCTRPVFIFASQGVLLGQTDAFLLQTSSCLSFSYSRGCLFNSLAYVQGPLKNLECSLEYISEGLKPYLFCLEAQKERYLSFVLLKYISYGLLNCYHLFTTFWFIDFVILSDVPQVW